MSDLSQKFKAAIQVKINGIESSTDTLVCEDDEGSAKKKEQAEEQTQKEQEPPVFPAKYFAAAAASSDCGDSGSDHRSSSSASVETSPGPSHPISVDPSGLFSSLQDACLLIDDDGLEAHADQVQDRMKEILFQHNVAVETLTKKLQVTQNALQEVLSRKGAAVPGPMADQAKALLELQASAPVNGCATLNTNGSTTSDGSWDNVDEKDTKPTLWMPDHTSDYCTK